MAERQRRRGNTRRRKSRKRRRLERMIEAWIARILVLSVLVLLVFGVVQSGLWVWGQITHKEETFQGARVLEPQERKPGTKLVVLDAGHGGKDQGTSAGEVIEKEINLAMVKKVAELLEDEETTVMFTREDDTKVGLEARATFANEQEADLFVSLHCNYCEDDAGVQGLECYYREDSPEGETMANQIVEAVKSEERIANRGTRTANFRVLCKTEMPAVLVEMGYLSNAEERGRMVDEEYQKVLAEKIAEGVREMLKEVKTED